MNRGRYRIGGLCSLAAAAVAAGVVAPALPAQQTTPGPAPTPTPASRLPNVMYLPNVTLGTPTPTPAPPPTVTVAPVATPAPAPTRAPAPRATAPARTTPAPAPAQAAPASQPSPVPTALAAPAAPTPLATTAPAEVVPQAAPATQPAGTPGWLWALLGASATALGFGAVWALRRRRRADAIEDAYEAPAATPAPVPAAPARPVAPPPGIAPPPLAPAAIPAAAPSGEPFEIILRPGSIEVTERDVLLDFELLIGNVQASAAENVRVTMAMMSANPDQDRQIAGYHASPMVDPAGVPFDLAAGAGGRLPARLALPRELIHVVEVQRRPMFVPLVMIELKWRAGISIRRFGADFMVGTSGQGSKLGPIWLDRNQQARQLAATRYLPRQAVAA